MIPAPGRIVHYRLTDSDAHQVNKRRQDALASAIASKNTGAVVHHGNTARAGDVLPMLIVKLWSETPTPSTTVNGQVFLDGNDSLWVTSVKQGDSEREWREPPRV